MTEKGVNVKGKGPEKKREFRYSEMHFLFVKNKVKVNHEPSL
jgi:hypothetical protein